MADVIVIEPVRHESNYWRDLWLRIPMMSPSRAFRLMSATHSD
jgi:hypothetical protein